jgi:hypothetical protein
MGPHDNGFTNTLWTQTIVMGPYDKGFTNTFWTETLAMGPDIKLTEHDSFLE